MNGYTSPPCNPSLENLKKLPKRLQVLWKRWHVDTLARIRESLPKHADASDEQIWRAKALVTDCQLVLAREAGFESWKTLKAAVESGSLVIEDPSLPDLYTDRDVDGAKALLQREPELASHDGYKAHPLLRECVSRNFGHCSIPPHMLIADLLIPAQVRSFRDAVIDDRIDDVRDQLSADPDLSAEFTAGRGIAQAIHHWQSTATAAHLLDAGADIYAQTSTPKKDTPLMMQTGFGTVEGVRFLLERGANPNYDVGNIAGLNRGDRHRVIIELLLDYGWDIDRGGMLHDANHGWGSRVRRWLDYGADPNYGRPGRTALHCFAAKGIGAETIRALAKAGADINARDNDGHTPLDLARLAKPKSAARELIALGAEES